MDTEMHIEGNTIRIDVAVPLAARLFGLPFLVMGGYILYTLLMSIADTASGVGTVGEMIGGQLLLAVFMLSFGGPGAILVFGGRTLIIDRGVGSIVERRKLGPIGLTTTTVPLKDVCRVRATLRLNPGAAPSLDVSRIAEQKAVPPTYDAELLDAKGAKLIVAGIFARAADAITYSADLARALSLPFEDHTKSAPATD